MNIDDSEIIDKNLKLIYKKNGEFYRTSFIDLNNNQLSGNESQILAALLEKLDLVTITNYRVDLTSFGLEIIKQGGWILYLDNKQKTQLRTETKEKLEFEKLEVELKKVKFDYKTRYIAIISIVIAVVSFFMSLYSLLF